MTKILMHIIMEQKADGFNDKFTVESELQPSLDGLKLRCDMRFSVHLLHAVAFSK